MASMSQMKMDRAEKVARREESFDVAQNVEANVGKNHVGNRILSSCLWVERTIAITLTSMHSLPGPTVTPKRQKRHWRRPARDEIVNF